MVHFKYTIHIYFDSINNHSCIDIITDFLQLFLLQRVVVHRIETIQIRISYISKRIYL